VPGQFPFHAENVHPPLHRTDFFGETGKFVELGKVAAMDHGGDSDRNSRLPDGPDACDGARKRPIAPQQVVAVLPAVKTDLEFLDREPAGRGRCDECTVGKDNAAQAETSRLFDEFPQVGIEERLTARNE